MGARDGSTPTLEITLNWHVTISVVTIVVTKTNLVAAIETAVMAMKLLRRECRIIKFHNLLRMSLVEKFRKVQYCVLVSESCLPLLLHNTS